MSDTLDVSTPPAAASPLLAACLRLCQVSYQPFGLVAEGVHFLPALDVPGKWKVLWGPAEDDIEANLAVVAGYYPDRAPGAPYVVAVGLRGTDVDVQNPCGVAYQVWEDMDAAFQTAFPYAGGSVAGGTYDALGVIQALADPTTGQSMTAFLADFYAGLAAPQPPVVVTGHSLGGCLTTVVMPWLKATLAQAAVAPAFAVYTFAAPTAGNPTFAAAVSQLGTMVSVRNSLDVATFAWEDFAGLKAVYTSHGLPAPLYVRAALDIYEGVLKLAGATYAQPAGVLELTGVFDPSNAGDWPDQALAQHHTTTYAALLGLTAIDTPREPGSRRKRRPRPAAKP